MFKAISLVLLSITSLWAKAEISYISNEFIKKSDFYTSIVGLAQEYIGKNQNIAISFGNDGIDQAISKSESFDFIIALLVTRFNYEKYHSDNNANKIIPIFIDPPIEVQIYLTYLLYPENAKVIIPYRPSNFFSPNLNGYQNIDLLKIETTNRWLRYLDRRVDAVIAHSDDAIYNSSNITSISKSLYRRNIGLIGFAPNMTKLGAVVSVFSDYGNMVEVTREILEKLLRQEKIQQYRFGNVRRYQVTVNIPLAKTLGLVHLDVSDLEKKINDFVGGGSRNDTKMEASNETINSFGCHIFHGSVTFNNFRLLQQSKTN